MNKKKFLDEIQGLIEEAEREAGRHETAPAPGNPECKPESAVPAPQSSADFVCAPRSSQVQSARQLRNPASKADKNLHEGHRGRVKNSADRDPDFTTFSDHEVLEYLLFNTIPRVDVNALSHHLIETFGSFSGVLNANINELKRVSYYSEAAARTLNIGEETARSLVSILPAARKAELSRVRNQAVLNNTAAAVNYLQPFFMNRGTEYVYLASLNNSDRVISVDLITAGDTNFSTVEIKKVVETACRHKAAKVIIAHNHPAGTLEPSGDDIDLTARLVISLMSINIVLSDHIIFTADNYYSLFARGDFEAIYTYIDSIFGTNLVKEIRAKPKNYRAGVYPSGADPEVGEKSGEPEFSGGVEKLPYTLGHPSPRKFGNKRSAKK